MKIVQFFSYSHIFKEIEKCFTQLFYSYDSSEFSRQLNLPLAFRQVELFTKISGFQGNRYSAIYLETFIGCIYLTLIQKNPETHIKSVKLIPTRECMWHINDNNTSLHSHSETLQLRQWQCDKSPAFLLHKSSDAWISKSAGA